MNDDLSTRAARRSVVEEDDGSELSDGDHDDDGEEESPTSAAHSALLKRWLQAADLTHRAASAVVLEVGNPDGTEAQALAVNATHRARETELNDIEAEISSGSQETTLRELIWKSIIPPRKESNNSSYPETSLRQSAQKPSGNATQSADIQQQSQKQSPPMLRPPRSKNARRTTAPLMIPLPTVLLRNSSGRSHAY